MLSLILIITGGVCGVLISKTKQFLFWDILFGSLGALSGYFLWLCFSSSNFSLPFALLGAVSAIYLSRWFGHTIEPIKNLSLK